VPPAHAHVDKHDDTDLGGEGRPDRSAILLADIDRVLEDSASVERADVSAPVRAWRDELTVALESLAYARAVLAADVGILRHSLATSPRDQQDLVDDLSEAVSGRPWDRSWSAPDDAEGHPQVDWDVCARSDQLMSAHQEMAHMDISSPEEVTRVLSSVQDQLSELARRQRAVEDRLRAVRAAIVRQYADGAVPTEDWLG